MPFLFLLPFSLNLYYLLLYFAAGYLIRKDVFFYNIGSILTYAFIGTGISAFLTGTIVFLFSEYCDVTYNLGFMDSMVLGSLISAVDPVATIAVLEKMHVDERLFILIFGEAVLNDAVAVVFFEVFKDVADGSRDASEALPPAIIMILLISIGSIIIGLACGFSSAYIFKKVGFHKFREIELIFFLISALVPYYLADI
eukprot:UN28043